AAGRVCLQFETPVHLRQVQFLSHQSKIASKIELFTAPPPPAADARPEGSQFKRLGYLSLDCNERSQFQARELKSVYVDVAAQFLRILLHKCHVNRYNIVNQVGLIALNCLGEVLGPDLATGPPPPHPALARSPGDAPRDHWPAAGSRAAPAPPAQAAAAPAAAAESIQDEATYDPRTLERIQALTAAKRRAVEAEDYEEAKRCKDMLARLRHVGKMLRELEDRKRACVQSEDYDAAKALKVEIERLRLSIEQPAGPPPAADQPPQGRTAADHQAAPPPPHTGTSSRGRHEPDDGAAEVGGAPPRRSSPPLRPQPTRPALPPAEARAVGAPPHAADEQDDGAEEATGAGAPSPTIPEHDEYWEEAAPKPQPAHASGGRQPPRSPPVGAARAGDLGAPPPAARLERASSDRSDPADLAGHPLAGVPNIEDLAKPEELHPQHADETRALHRVHWRSERCADLARCLCSKTWNLRDAALQKLSLELAAGAYDGQDPGRLLSVFGAVLRRAIPDKNVQVFLSSAALLQGTLRRTGGRRGAQPALEPLVPLLVDRLGDANARVEKTTKDALMLLAQSAALGIPACAQHLLRPPQRKTVPPRVLVSRLQLLTALVGDGGVQPESPHGLPLDQTVQLAVDWFNNKEADVRTSAVRLVAACHALVGLGRIAGHLQQLRPAQREVFDAEFEAAGRDHAALTPAAASARRGSAGAVPGLPPPSKPPTRGDNPSSVGGGTTQTFEYSDDEADESTCQFCGRHDPSFTVETIDVHYWRECPMLAQCEFCQQVIEISTLHSHWCEECEKEEKARARAEATTGSQCPLCAVELPGTEDADWREHLLEGGGCPKNPRRVPRPAD
ncbi:unnamed protein product, partial [Prorocentrum cordatum]